MNPGSPNNSPASITVVNVGYGTNSAGDLPPQPMPNPTLQTTIRPTFMVATPTISESADELKLNLPKPKSFRGHERRFTVSFSSVDYEGQSVTMHEKTFSSSKARPYGSLVDSNNGHMGGSYFSTPGAHSSTSPTLTIQYPAPSSPMTTLATLSGSSPDQHFVLTMPDMSPLSPYQGPAHNPTCEPSHNEVSISHSALTPTHFSLPVLAKVVGNAAEGYAQNIHTETVSRRPSPVVAVLSGIPHLATGATPKTPVLKPLTLGDELDSLLPSCFHFTNLEDRLSSVYTQGVPCEHYSLTSHNREATADDTSSQQTIETAPLTFDIVGNQSPGFAEAHLTFPPAFVSSSSERERDGEHRARSSSSPLSDPIVQNTNSTASLGAFCYGSLTPRLPRKRRSGL